MDKDSKEYQRVDKVLSDAHRSCRICEYRFNNQCDINEVVGFCRGDRDKLLLMDGIAILADDQSKPSPDEWKHEDDEYLDGYADCKQDMGKDGFKRVI